MVVSFCAVLFPTRSLGWDLELNWVSFWGFSFLLSIRPTLSFLRRSRHNLWLRKNPYPLCPVFSCPSWGDRVHSCPLFYIVFPLFFCVSFLFLSLWPVGSSLLNQKNLTRVRISSYSPIAALIFLWASSLITWYLYEMISSISSQRPAFFLTLLSRPTIQKHTDIWKWQGNASASLLTQEIRCYPSKLASVL